MAAPPSEPELKVRVPAGVVHRVFGDQLVILNLETGQYHGLNATARRMFELIVAREGTAGIASDLAAEYGRPGEEIADDLRQLCQSLAQRGLIELEPAPG